MNCVAVIPARLSSKRLPGKPLLPLGKITLIQHIYERVSSVPGIERVFVATDARRVFDCVRGFGGLAKMTTGDHHCGSDRVAEATAQSRSKWVFNVQGDQPFLDPETLEKMLDHAVRHGDVQACTAAAPIHSSKELMDPAVVKVVVDENARALYFSRLPIPYLRDGVGVGFPREISGEDAFGAHDFPYLRHLGIYLYRREFLQRFAGWPQGRLELAEHLEQLRILENGYTLSVIQVERASLTVDTPADYEQACRFLKSNHSGRAQ